MQFSTKAAALQPHQEGALLYICRNRENALDNETARLLLESLAEGERFAAAQTAASGILKAVALALPATDGRKNRKTRTSACTASTQNKPPKPPKSSRSPSDRPLTVSTVSKKTRKPPNSTARPSTPNTPTPCKPP